ncbi:MAG TPA: hypothetical protein VFQ35_05245 [Polyangiaceae bacterium]|nr:hypothetical protein [Polyangiaceae bacterium]
MADDDAPRDASGTGGADVALIHGVTDNGDLKIVRQREGRLELGEVRPLREGVPIAGEVVKLTPRKEFPLLCDVTSELAVAPSAPKQDVVEAPVGHKGPAQVATDRYRENWDLIWKRRSSGNERAN